MLKLLISLTCPVTSPIRSPVTVSTTRSPFTKLKSVASISLIELEFILIDFIKRKSSVVLSLTSPAYDVDPILPKNPTSTAVDVAERFLIGRARNRRRPCR